METAVVRQRMPGGVGGQRCEPLPTRLAMQPHPTNSRRNCRPEFENHPFHSPLMRR